MDFSQLRMPYKVGWHDFALSAVFSISLVSHIAAVMQLQELAKLLYSYGFENHGKNRVRPSLLKVGSRNRSWSVKIQ